MRLFIAIDLPQNAKEYIEDIKSSLNFTGMSIAHEAHLTLFFLGECDEDKLIKIKAALKNIRFRSFEMTLDSRGIFGNRHYPRICFLSINAPKELFDLHSNISSALSRIGFESDSRPFKPHITLARIRMPQNIATVDEFLKAKSQKIKVKVDSFALFRSHLSPHGAKYEILDSYQSCI